MFEAKSTVETGKYFKTDIEKGLSEKDAERRGQEQGKNRLKESKKKTFLQSFWEQVNDPLIYVLMAAAAVSVFLKEISDAMIIGVVILVNAVVGMIQEGKAQKALDSLKKLTSPHACVIRDGIKKEILAEDLVTGDLVCLEAGCQVPADLRLVQTQSLKIVESALTGESLPVEKDSRFLPECIRKSSRGQSWGRENTEGEGTTGEIPLGDRHNMAYMSTMVTYGRGEGIVTATGMQTEIGKIASMLEESREEMTPLQKRLGELGELLSVLSVILCVALFIIAAIQHRNIPEMLITAISLAVAAVPEGLPAVVTICLALSVTRMVKAHTIVRKLPSVETLGAVSVVCSDKTGTLTQNKMRVELCYVNQGLCKRGELDKAEQREFLEGLTLCNDAVYNAGSHIGDPTELALLELTAEYGIYREKLEGMMPREQELAFDSDRKMMSTFHRRGTSTMTYTKGAPDEILKKCSRVLLRGKASIMTDSQRRQIQGAIREMSSKALRIIGLAMRSGGTGPEERDLVFVGMAGMMDPVRPEAAEAVRKFKKAGVSTVMITGDHVATAFAIGKQLGIVEEMAQCMTGEEIAILSREAFLQRLDFVRVFARVSPAQKVEIVRGLKEKGFIAAMTGDGVNDAPSLKEADIGIAMGMTGTDVAKQASDMILTDDNFATIERAIEEGRGVYENIRKSVIFLLSSNLGEIMTMFTAVVLGLASPLKSSHILWINLITDSLPALALGVDENDREGLMELPPRKPGESLFARGGLLCTVFYGILIAAISLTAFFIQPFGYLMANHLSFSLQNIGLVLGNTGVVATAQTYAFTVLGMSQLFHAIGMRDIGKSVFKMNHLGNKMMIFACIAGFFLQWSVTEVPFLINAFGTVRLSLTEWGCLVVLAAFPLLAHELLVSFKEQPGERTVPQEAETKKSRPETAH